MDCRIIVSVTSVDILEPQCFADISAHADFTYYRKRTPVPKTPSARYFKLEDYTGLIA